MLNTTRSVLGARKDNVQKVMATRFGVRYRRGNCGKLMDEAIKLLTFKSLDTLN